VEFKRPPHLNVEQLTDDELTGCGLIRRGGVAKLSKDSPEYKAWRSFVQVELEARQLSPVQQRPVQDRNFVRGQIPPKPKHTNHTSDWHDPDQSSVPPANGWPVNPTANFAGRQIGDGYFVLVGQPLAANCIRNMLLVIVSA
jgi:hypothetical protein